MKPIPETFSKNGYHYELERRSAKACIYRQIHRTGKLVAYEVMAIRVRPEREYHGCILPACERLTSNEEWGTYGWTFSGPEAHEQAIRQFKKLQDRPAVPARGVLPAEISA